MVTDHDNNTLLISAGLAVAAASVVGLVVVATGRADLLLYLLPIFFLTAGGSVAWLSAAAHRKSGERQDQLDMESALKTATAMSRAIAGIPGSAAAAERDVIRMGGRVVPYYRPANPHEAAWRNAIVHFSLHAWRAKSWTVSALVGPAVDSRDDWMAITDVMAGAGYLIKQNGLPTMVAKPWTFRKIIRHVQLGEGRLDLPQPRAPTVRIPEVLNATAASIEAARPDGDALPT